MDCGPPAIPSKCGQPRNGGKLLDQTLVILVTLVSYKLVLIGIGLWASRRVHNETDFLLGGRNLGPWVAGLSYAASTSSAWVLFGFTGFVFVNGVSALWMVPGLWGGYIAMWLWLGPRIRRESNDMKWITPSELIAANVDSTNRKRIAALAAILILFCFVFYIAAQFDAAAQAFVGNFAMDRANALLLGAVIILIYCLLGGFWAASVTDTLQALVMMATAVIVPTLAVIAAGGPAQIFSDVAASGGSYADWRGGFPLWIFAGFVLGVWGIGLGALGQPQLIARLMAVRGERERRQGFIISFVWAVVIYVGMACLALAARSMAVEAGNGEQLFYLMASKLLSPVLAGLVIAAILSAVMSTVDSLLLAASAAVSHDLGLARRFTHLGEIWVARIVMTIIAAAAVLLALTLPDTIFNRVLFAWSALGAAFGPILVARVMGREPPPLVRLWSISLGFGITVFFYLLGTLDAAEVNSGLGRVLVNWARLPGDPFERVVPWVPAVILLFFWPPRGQATDGGD